MPPVAAAVPVPVPVSVSPASASPLRLPAGESRLSANAPSCALSPTAPAPAPAAPPPRTKREGSVPARARVVVLVPDPDPAPAPDAAMRPLLLTRTLSCLRVMVGAASPPSRGAIAVALGRRSRESEPMTLRQAYVAWGGQRPGTPVAETSGHSCFSQDKAHSLPSIYEQPDSNCMIQSI